MTHLLQQPFMALVIQAIILLESGGDPLAVNKAEGAYGILQIRKIYVEDVNRIAGTTFTHEDAFNEEKAMKMFVIYNLHYIRALERREGRKATWEDVVRMHNGGPDGYRQEETLQYLAKVKEKLKEISVGEGG